MEEDWEYWYEKSIEFLGDILESAELDEDTGEIILYGPWGERGLVEETRFQTIEDVKSYLSGLNLEIQEIEEEYPHDEYEIDPWLVDNMVDGSEIPLLIGDSDYPDLDHRFFDYRDFSTNIIPVETRIELIKGDEELIRFLSEEPKLIYSLSPRKFEEIIAEIFSDLGYEIVLTPKTRDGGSDIWAIRKDPIGTLFFLIECKKYAPNRPVGIEVVRSLYGVTMAEQANCGIIATTSYFSKDAKEFANKVKYHISFRDYYNLRDWFDSYGTNIKS